MEKKIICTVCPTGCIMNVTGNDKEIFSIEGYTCARGKKYGEAEFLAPVRILTSTVKVEDSNSAVVSCRSNKPLPKDKMMSCMEVIHKVSVKAPVKRGDVLISDIMATGVDIVATGEVF